MKTGIELLAQERQEQIEKHGRTIESDVLLNNRYQLYDAASRLLVKFPEGRFPVKSTDISADNIIRSYAPTFWKDEIWRKMFNKPYKERLIIAGALIAAELDRIQNTNKNE